GLVAKSERSQSYYDRFRGRLMFPVIRPGGSVLGFSGRIVPVHDSKDDQDPTPKYINSSESDLYAKNKTLFGLQAASRHIKTRGRALLVEGNLDVVSLHQRGHGEAVAPLGTAFTSEQCAVLGRLTSVVVLCFDGDRAGRKATAAAIEQLLNGGIEPRVVALEPEEDPDSVDPEIFARRLERPTPALEWFLRRLVAAGATESIESQARALHRVAPLLQKLKDPDVRGDYAHLAANLLRLPVSRVWSACQPEARGRRSGPDPRNAPPPPRDDRPTRPQTPLPRGQALLTALLVDLPLAAGGAVREQVLEHVDDPRLAPIIERVLEAASEGRHASVGELLALVDPEAEQLLHRAVFQGRFLEESQPHRVLQQGLTLCKLVK
ncbi:MAG: toprim domain-containing protein, partial [Nannocystaceae bacterium]